MKKAMVWKFPACVDICQVSRYLSLIEKLEHSTRVVFDMQDIEDIHSSFLGFLVFSKEKLVSRGGTLVLRMSPYMQKTVTRLGMSDYFSIQDISGTFFTRGDAAPANSAPGV
jgi:anti-anti-sigma regulatory factor